MTLVTLKCGTREAHFNLTRPRTPTYARPISPTAISNSARKIL